MNDFKGFTMRDLSITSDDNVINLLDGRDLLLDNIRFTLPENKLYVYMKGERTKNIEFKNIQPEIEIIKEK